MDFLSQQVSVGTVLVICAALVLSILWIGGIILNLKLQKDVAITVSDKMARWEEHRLSVERSRLETTIAAEFRLSQQQWKSEYTAQIRQDAIDRSKSVIAGRVAENIAPFLPTFPYNPKDARFLGSPIDYVVFHGLDAGEIQEVVFLEFKTQGARMTQRERQIRDAIYSGRVSWQELRWTSEALNQALPNTLYDDL